MTDLFLASASIVLAYLLLANRLFAFARTFRDDYVELAEFIGRDSRVSDERRAMIARRGTLITEARAAWMLALMLPIAIAADLASYVRRSFTHQSNQTIPISDLPPEMQDKYNRLVRNFIIATLCASPAALVIFGLTIGLASFTGAGFRLADDALFRLLSWKAGGQDNLCPPRQPI